jgi:hypothetical protein
MVCIVLFYGPECIGIISLEYKRPAVPAIFADIYLADISPGDCIDLLAFTDRTVKHIQQLYMSIRYKN